MLKPKKLYSQVYMGKRGPKPGSVKRPKGAGRKLGTPNKRTWALVSELERLGFEPAAKYVQLILDNEADYHKNRKNELGPQYSRVATVACGDLMKFVYPTRKAVDVTTDGQNVANSFAELVKAVMGDTSGTEAPTTADDSKAKKAS